MVCCQVLKKKKKKKKREKKKKSFPRIQSIAALRQGLWKYRVRQMVPTAEDHDHQWGEPWVPDGGERSIFAKVPHCFFFKYNIIFPKDIVAPILFDENGILVADDHLLPVAADIRRVFFFFFLII